jgi:hypothetical protein
MRSTAYLGPAWHALVSVIIHHCENWISMKSHFNPITMEDAWKMGQRGFESGIRLILMTHSCSTPLPQG